jgi:hypothetical protein
VLAYIKERPACDNNIVIEHTPKIHFLLKQQNRVECEVFCEDEQVDCVVEPAHDNAIFGKLHFESSRSLSARYTLFGAIHPHSSHLGVSSAVGFQNAMNCFDRVVEDLGRTDTLTLKGFEKERPEFTIESSVTKDTTKV